MTACPSRDLIVELLNERLERPELAEIVAHIEDCLRCQDTPGRPDSRRRSARQPGHR